MKVLCPWCSTENDDPGDGRRRVRCWSCGEVFDLEQARWQRPELRRVWHLREQNEPTLPGLEEE